MNRNIDDLRDALIRQPDFMAKCDLNILKRDDLITNNVIGDLLLTMELNNPIKLEYFNNYTTITLLTLIPSSYHYFTDLTQFYENIDEYEIKELLEFVPKHANYLLDFLLTERIDSLAEIDSDIVIMKCLVGNGWSDVLFNKINFNNISNNVKLACFISEMPIIIEHVSEERLALFEPMHIRIVLEKQPQLHTYFDYNTINNDDWYIAQ